MTTEILQAEEIYKLTQEVKRLNSYIDELENKIDYMEGNPKATPPDPAQNQKCINFDVKQRAKPDT